MHSRFFDRHRKATEKQLKALFGKDVKDKKTNSILISTQVIEAGMDISCEVMHTEIAPINALLQRVGRCARYTGEYGKVFVYDVLDEEEKAKIDIEDFKDLSKEEKSEIWKLKNKYLPYDEPLCKVTFEKLKLPENQQLSEAVTIRLVNEILEQEEDKIWSGISSDNYKYNGIKKSWETSVTDKFGAKNLYRELVRDIQSTEVVIIDNSDFAVKVPFSLESVGIFKWSMIKWIKEVFEEHQHKFDDESDFWIVGVIRDKDDLFLDLDKNEIKYEFHSLKDIEAVKETHETLYLNKDLFHYHHSIGFNKRNKGSEKSDFKERKDKEQFIHAYRKDTFIQHTEGLLGAFQQDFIKNNQLDFVFNAFNSRLKAKVDFKKLIQLILILHDYGKLDDRWQKWMQTYQKALSELDNSPFTYQDKLALGHTGFDTKEEKERLGEQYEEIVKKVEKSIKEKLKGGRPRHSGVGAWVIIDVLEEWLGDDEKLWEKLFIPASYAIARHHGVSNDSSPDFFISNQNYQPIKHLLNKYGFGEYQLSQKEEVNELDDFVEYNQTSFLMYLFFVRILRLCDQKATDDFEKYLN